MDSKIKLIAQHNIKGITYDVPICEFTHVGYALTVARMIERHGAAKFVMQVYEQKKNPFDITGGLRVYTVERFLEKYKN